MLLMAKVGLSALACAGLLLTSVALAQDREPSITVTLAVQTALQQGRTHLLRGNHALAVQALESQLARINGNADYLAVLRDAYRAHIKDLRLARKDAEADEYLKRLRVLDPSAAAEPAVAYAQPVGAGPKPPEPEPPKPTVTARGKSEEAPRSEPPHPTALPPAEPSVLERAEREFAARHYEEAGKLFEQAAQTSQALGTESRERWAYCKLYVVVGHLNQPSAASPSAADLEREVRLALCLAPRLQEYGKDLLAKIQERRAPPPPTAPAVTAVAVRHSDRPVNGWSIAETTNCRIFHNQSRELAEKAAQVVEATRVSVGTKWLGDAGPDWTPRCDVYLHTTAQDYARETGMKTDSPAHSTFRSENGRLVSRRIDLHCDDPRMLSTWLPHEATHVALAGRLGAALPRWADEGMAMLSEPRATIEPHLRNLAQYAQDNTLLGLREIVQMADWPNPRFISAFYAQSVSLVEFLTREKGPQTFTAFVKDGQAQGYEAALRKHYGMQGFDDLEQRWRKYALGGSSSAKR
jgi:tetratricopeptide (TPR) repeat protein